MTDPMAIFRSRYPGMFGTPTPLPTSNASDGMFSFQSGARTPYGTVPNQIKPPAAAEHNIQSDLMGVVSPETQAKLQNEAARFGVASGMPGSGLGANKYLHDYLGETQAAKDRGFAHYKDLLPLAERNAELAAAPDPQQRAQTEQSFAQQMFNQYLGALRGGGGSGGGGSMPRFSNPAGGTIAPTRSNVREVPESYSYGDSYGYDAPVYPGEQPAGAMASSPSQDEVDQLINSYLNQEYGA